MPQAIAQYDALWQTLRTRRQAIERPTGLDAKATRWHMRLAESMRSVRRWDRLAGRVLAMDAEIAALTDAALDARVATLRGVFRRKRANEAHVIDALACLRELASRVLGQKPYRVQVVGALAMYHGQVVQMATGEGKTLTATMPATLLAWSYPAVHIVTANDYLAGRDATNMGPLYRRAGVSVAAVLPTHKSRERLGAYRQNVVYTTQKELVADWLRDYIRMGPGRDAPLERLAPAPGRVKPVTVLVPGLHAVIVDEADAVLIDQAVTPLIIATAREKNRLAGVYRRAAEFAKQLEEGPHFRVEARYRRVKLNDPGKRHLATLLTQADISGGGPWRAPRRRHELVEQALTAIHCYQRGVQYEVADGRAVMIDEFTGRFQPDRHWQHGMHQAVEAKEGLEISGDGRSLASLSFQRFFRLYPHLCGMTGTARGSRDEFETTYEVPVRIVPTNRPVLRAAWKTQVYATAEQRWIAVADSVEKLHASGRPVLIGTRSVAASEKISRLLSDRKLEHQVLNAVHHEQEAAIIAAAGQRRAITVATNMAGRGTDILLGEGVRELGGLHVILTEMHEAQRVDAQLIGRAGRQGDPGSSQIFVSLEDELLTKYAPTIAAALRRIYGHRVGPIRSMAIRRVFRTAQRRAERAAFSARKMILQRDDWLDQVVPGG